MWIEEQLHLINSTCKCGKYSGIHIYSYSFQLPSSKPLSSSKEPLLCYVCVPKAYSLNPDTYFRDSLHASFVNPLLKYAFISFLCTTLCKFPCDLVWTSWQQSVNKHYKLFVKENKVPYKRFSLNPITSALLSPWFSQSLLSLLLSNPSIFLLLFLLLSVSLTWGFKKSFVDMDNSA